MRIRFQEKVYEIPVPVLGAAEILLQVDAVYVLDLPDKSKQSRPSIQNPFWKLGYFMVRDGPRLTIAKVRSFLLQRKLIAERKVVFAYGKVQGSDHFGIAIGPQDCAEAEFLVFPSKLYLPVAEDRDLGRDYAILDAFFKEKPDLLDALFHYSPYSGKAVDFSIEDALRPSGAGEQLPAIRRQPVFSPSASTCETGSGERRRERTAAAAPDLFLAGAGSYSWSYVLPAVSGHLRLHTVVDHNPALACVTAEKHRFHWADTNHTRAFARLRDCETPVLIVVTYHSTHFQILQDALAVNPNTKILVEKPPVTTIRQLQHLIELRRNGAYVEIGYNRRYAPMIQDTKRIISRCSGPVVVTCIVKELGLLDSHWYYWPNQGSRITGNLVHWVDIATYLIGGRPVSLHVAPAQGAVPGDEVTLVVSYDDGSRLTLMATDRGNSLRGVQEYIDIRRDDVTIMIEDFVRMRVQSGARQRTTRALTRNKGHTQMYRSFARNVRGRTLPEYPAEDLSISTNIYLAASDAVRKGQASVALDFDTNGADR